MTDTLVKPENVSKTFFRSLKRSLWYGMHNLTPELLGRNSHRGLRQDEFRAVSDVSFQNRTHERITMTNIHHPFVSLTQEVAAQVEAIAKIEETL